MFEHKGKIVEYLIGAGLALSVSLLARFVGLDRDRAFYPTVMIVIASYYGLFAVMSGSMQALGWESIAIAGFLLVTILGFKLNLWFVVGASERHVSHSEIVQPSSAHRSVFCHHRNGEHLKHQTAELICVLRSRCPFPALRPKQSTLLRFRQPAEFFELHVAALSHRRPSRRKWARKVPAPLALPCRH